MAVEAPRNRAGRDASQDLDIANSESGPKGLGSKLRVL